MDIKIFNSAVDASLFVAEEILKEIQRKPKCNLGVATGRTMDAVYFHFVKKSQLEDIDVSHVKIFALDEYIGLRQGSESSFEFYLRLHLINQLNFSNENINIPPSHMNNIDIECAEYEKKIIESGNIDLQLLGIGTNGHIGLNEPGSSLDSRTRVVALTSSTIESNKSLFLKGEIPKTAATMGVGTILESHKCILVATGETKAEIVQKLVNGDINSKIPASAIKLHQNAILVLDKEAAKLI